MKQKSAPTPSASQPLFSVLKRPDDRETLPCFSSSKQRGERVWTQDRVCGSMKRHVLEQRLEVAKKNLETRATALKTSGASDASFASDPVWRNLDAARRQAATRLFALGKIEKRDAEALARKEGGGEAEE
jgi:hypothetical protein